MRLNEIFVNVKYVLILVYLARDQRVEWNRFDTSLYQFNLCDFSQMLCLL